MWAYSKCSPNTYMVPTIYLFTRCYVTASKSRNKSAQVCTRKVLCVDDGGGDESCKGSYLLCLGVNPYPLAVPCPSSPPSPRFASPPGSSAAGHRRPWGNLPCPAPPCPPASYLKAQWPIIPLSQLLTPSQIFVITCSEMKADLWYIYGRPFACDLCFQSTKAVGQ